MTTTTATNSSIAPNSVVTGRVPLASAAATSYNTDTPANAVLVLTAGTEGARITKAEILLRDTTAADRVLLYIGNDASGTTKRTLKSKAVAQYTWSTTGDPPAYDFGYSEDTPLILGPNESLWALHLVAQTGTPIIVSAEGGKYNTP